jgi:hypothetical protein
MRRYLAVLLLLIAALSLAVVAAPASAKQPKHFGSASGKVTALAIPGTFGAPSPYVAARTLTYGVTSYIRSHYYGNVAAWGIGNFHYILSGRLTTAQFSFYNPAYSNNFYGGWFMGQGRVADNGYWYANWSY